MIYRIVVHIRAGLQLSLFMEEIMNCPYMCVHGGRKGIPENESGSEKIGNKGKVFPAIMSDLSRFLLMKPIV